MAVNLRKNKPSAATLSTAADSTDNRLAFQHNHLIRTPLRMGLVEARIFIHALGQVHQTDKAFKPLKIPVSAVVGHEPNGEDYKGIHAACKALVRQILNLLPVNAKRGRLHEVPLMADIALDPGTGFITGQFNEKAKPYLLNLKEAGNFTRANVETLLTFTNPNSARLYWILLSFRNLEGPKVQIQLKDLKVWMLKDDILYPIFAEFKRRVLDPIAEDFQRIGFNATWEPVKTGRSTTALLFTIPKEKAPKRKLLASAPGSDVATATDTDTSSFSAFLSATKDRKLQAAYKGLREFNQLTDATAQDIIRWVHQHPEKHADFYPCRHRIRTHKEPVANMASFSLKALNAVLGTNFK